MLAAVLYGELPFRSQSPSKQVNDNLTGCYRPFSCHIACLSTKEVLYAHNEHELVYLLSAFCNTSSTVKLLGKAVRQTVPCKACPGSFRG